jgi:hypothetical protein
MSSARGFLAAALVIAWAASASAEWIDQGTPICLASGDQAVPHLAFDGSGGAIITWCTFTFEPEFEFGDIYAQRIDARGNVEWAENGVPVCTATGQQYYPQAVSDGSGGAIIVWIDARSGIAGIYAQRLSDEGLPMWTADGVAVCSSVYDQYTFAMSGDGSGGAIIAWAESRAGNSDVYAQRIRANGSAAWASGGTVVCDASENQLSPSLVPDGSGGAVIAWGDNRSGDEDVYLQWINADGSPVWAAGGVAVCTADSMQAAPHIIADGSGGVIVTWVDGRGGKRDVYAQRVDATGAARWAADGVPVCTAGGNKGGIAAITDGARGAIVSWYEGRSCGETGCSDLFAQRIDENGGALWPADGVVVCDAPQDQVLQQMVSDGAGGVILGWWDFRSDNGDIYGQRIDSNGSPRWTANGLAISAVFGCQYYPTAIYDGAGGMIITWQDVKYYNHIFAQRIERNGYWGNPSPQITDVQDVPEDDGGVVSVTWERSRLDASPDHIVSRYSVWREADGDGDALHAASSWEQVGYVNADYSAQYQLIVSTLVDSSSTGSGLTRLQVVAETSDPDVFWTSPPDSGYSVDNLPPMPVEGFAGTQSITPPGLNLSWQECESPDVSHYGVYRGDHESFVPDVTNLIGTAATTTFFDPGWSPADNTFYYKLIAVDTHGNCSIASLLRPEDITVGTLLQGFHAAYGNGGIDVSWRLSEAGRGIRFVIMRAEGSAGAFVEMRGTSVDGEGLCFTFRDAAVEPGSIYRYRVDVSDEEGDRRLFETEGIETPALPLTLYQNHPNPFNPSTSIRYYLPEDARVVLEIYDVAGRSVVLLVNEPQKKGAHVALWNGVDRSGGPLSSGAYFCRLKAGKEVLSRTMILLR